MYCTYIVVPLLQFHICFPILSDKAPADSKENADCYAQEQVYDYFEEGI